MKVRHYIKNQNSISKISKDNYSKKIDSSEQ